MEPAENRAIRPLLKVLQLRSASFSNELSQRQPLKLRLKREISVGLEATSPRSAPLEVPGKRRAATKGRAEKRSKKTPPPPDPAVESSDEHRVRGIVDIQLTAMFEDDDGNKLDGIEATATYKALFRFSTASNTADIEAAMESEAYQYQFVAQAVPLAVRHFKDQLAVMGFSSNTLVLGIV